jgi:IS5 family transposase
VSFTTAKVHDSKEKEELQHGEEQAIFGDSAYSNKADKVRCREEGGYDGISDKGQRNKPLSKKQKKKNRKHSAIRAKGEHPFRTLKVVWKHRKLRYKVLAKNTKNVTMLCALQNIFCSRSKILALKGC